MLKVGLTGGIGSGKTTVANLFARFGVPIVDSDLIARKLTLPDGEAFLAIVAKFGESILNENGEIYRTKLRDIIFKDPSSKNWLEGLLHPLIKEAINSQTEEIPYPYCIIAIPLLIEAQAYDLIDRILVVESDCELRIKRAVTRDGTTESDVMRIINTQASSAQRLAVADDIIYNNGDLDSLVLQVEKLHACYLQIATLT